MKTLPFLMLLAATALADELVTANLAGNGIQCFQTSSGAKIAWQCPGIAARYRPICSGCALDAGATADGGPGDFVVDFNANPDPWGPVTMAVGYSKMCVANVDGGYLRCSFARVSP